MSLYFDIDGVLKGTTSLKEDIEALILYCIEHYPHTTYWLTTHCKGGINRTRSALVDVFPNELLNQIENTFQPTDWNVLKTDAIDFSKPFVWFDDTVLRAELDVMDKKMPEDATYGLFLCDKHDPNAAKDALDYLKQVESTLKSLYSD